MRRLGLLLVALVLYGAGYGTRLFVEARFPPPPAPPGAPRVAGDLVPETLYDVADVKDGDTFELVGGVDVRLLGVDTPESGGSRGVQWYGLEAKQFTRQLLEGQRVRLRPDGELTFRDKKSRDRFGRALAYVQLEDDTDVNRLLVETGCSPANRKYKCSRTDEFIAAEEGAKADGLGLWDADAEFAWRDVHIIPEVPLAEASVIASSSKLVHALDCGRAPAPKNGTPFVDEKQAAKHGFARRHSCLESRFPAVPREAARVIASRGSTSVHALECERLPREQVFFESVEQAAEFGFVKPHGCLTEPLPVVAPEEASFVGTASTKLLHTLDCGRAPAAGVLFRDLEQAAAHEYRRKHGCIAGR